MFAPRLSFAIVLALSASACTHSPTQRWNDLLSFQPPQTPQHRPAQNLGAEITHLWRDATDVVNASIPASAGIRISLKTDTRLVPTAGTPDAVEVQGEFALVATREHTEVYPPGRYLLNSPAARTFALAVTDLISQTHQRLHRQHQVLVTVDYFGGADGLKVNKLRYSGEFGPLAIDPAQLLINGVQPSAPLRLNAGDAISNEQLAVLRAIAMQHLFEESPRLTQPNLLVSSRLFANTHEDIGAELRYAKVSIKIQRRPLNLTLREM